MVAKLTDQSPHSAIVQLGAAVESVQRFVAQHAIEVTALRQELEGARESCKVLKRENEGLRALASRSLLADRKVQDLVQIANALLKAVNADLKEGINPAEFCSPAVVAGLNALDLTLKALDDP